MGKQKSEILDAVALVMTVVIFIVIAALIVGTLLSNSVFTAITIVNVTALSASFGSFVTGLVGFIGIIGTILGVLWLVKYVGKMFTGKDSLSSLSN